MNNGDTAWILISSALVMLMTPGLAFFYGGMVRKKNILSVLMQCFTILALISIQWVLFGYSIAFSKGNGFFGYLEWFGLKNIGFGTGPYSDTIPHIIFVMFQAMFAIITPALIVGTFVERMKFSFFVLFTLLWATFIYDPVCHWIWAKDGWLATNGILDFAGGTVVHINAGISALAIALLIGKRRNTNLGSTPHNLVFTLLGVSLLWFGWFGFNAGSALAANGLAANAFLVTNTAAAAASLSWIFMEQIFLGKPTTLGMATGIVAGLVAITPASGFVDGTGAILIGLFVSPVCFVIVTSVKKIFGYDDTLDVFGIHGIGGIIGAILTGLFANPEINELGKGVIFGNMNQIWIQIFSVVVVILYSFIGTTIIFKILNIFIKARVEENEEALGLDLSEYNERAYTLIE
ncbi:MAG: ammonium transporter [Candidatus Goldbacteria bacterium]|nr:ammonium transporter [Candidatus Goldiibacteriota bacterium]